MTLMRKRRPVVGSVCTDCVEVDHNYVVKKKVYRRNVRLSNNYSVERDLCDEHVKKSLKNTPKSLLSDEDKRLLKSYD